jgi:hypothetical protein
MADISTVAQIYDNSGSEITAARVGANAYKFVDPASQFGTRKIRFVKIVNGGDLTSGDFTTSKATTNSNLAKAVRCAQNYGELIVVGTPSATGLIVGYSDDTLNDGSAASPSASDASYAKLEAELVAALGGTHTVTTVVPTGITFA